MNCDLKAEELSAFAAGDLSEPRAETLAKHVTACERCRGLLSALQRVDELMVQIPREEPSPQALLAARQASAMASGIEDEASEVMTIEEVAAYLRVSRHDIEEMTGELPAFELAGQIRVRRSALDGWIREREQLFRQSTAASAADQGKAILFKKGAA